MDSIFPSLISAARVQLHALDEADYSAARALFCHPQVSKTYMLPDFKTEEDVHRLFDRIRQLSADQSRFVYGIYRQDYLIGLINEVDRNGQEIELGYAIHPDHHNRGYGTEMLKACIQTLFENGFTIVNAGAFPENRASQRVMEKCGMQLTPKTETIEYRGVTYTCKCYAIHRPETDKR